MPWLHCVYIGVFPPSLFKKKELDLQFTVLSASARRRRETNYRPDIMLTVVHIDTYQAMSEVLYPEKPMQFAAKRKHILLQWMRDEAFTA